jgi:feruloyl-CoA synthase
MVMQTGSTAPLFAPPSIVADTTADGGLLLRSTHPLGEYPATVMHSVRAWAALDPGHPLVAERDSTGAWRTCSYGVAVAAADAIGQALLDRGLGPENPLLILSGNSVDHLLMTLAAMTVGVPVAPVSVAYSLQSRDHATIRAITALIRPGAVFAEDANQFAAALDVVTAVAETTVITSTGTRPGADLLESLKATPPAPKTDADPDAVAKILFTSGSTGAPKGVLNTHRMLSANQQMMRQVWPFLATEPAGRAERPVIVDWLPWSHTFGGNHNMNMMLTSGGTLYVDAGRPAPGAFAPSIANLTEIPPTLYFNVPAGYAQLVPALEADPVFAARFFSRLRLMFNAAAALPAALRDRLCKLTPGAVPITGSWGATETAPAVTTAHFDYSDARCIGAPLPGTQVKLVPAEGGYEIRVKGPGVTPGYFARPDLTAAAFDDQGFYRSGDAVAPADPADPNAGLVFRGRIAEDFKLATGTFVRVGAVRTALLSAVPLLSDTVIAGEDRDCVCALAWLNMAEVRARLGEEPEPRGELIDHEQLRKELARALAEFNAGQGSSARIERLLVMARPADLDAGEITDKGYVNQRRVLTNRAPLVQLLYPEPAQAAQAPVVVAPVVIAERTP